MKTFKYLVLFYAICLSISCGNQVDRPDPVLTTEQIAKQQSITEQSVIPEGGAISSVQHYYCPNSCAGSGGDTAGSCPVCGTEYIHNQAYHNTPTTGQSATTTTPEPDQNAAGVWHYTCSNGCSGGAGSAIACSQCGNTLVHNTLYHN